MNSLYGSNRKAPKWFQPTYSPSALAWLGKAYVNKGSVTGLHRDYITEMQRAVQVSRFNVESK